MQYWGKLLGLVMGILSGGGFWGILLGVLCGHLFDRSYAARSGGFFSNQQARQAFFFYTVFQVMGHLTKAKGRVTQRDIHTATQLMDRMQLAGEARVLAQQAFREGKHSHYPLREKVRELRRVCSGRSDLIRTFLEIQLQAAFADGKLHPSELQVLRVIADELGVSRQQFEAFLRMAEGGSQFGGQQQWQRYSQGDQRRPSPRPTLADACKVLGVKTSDDAATIKRAYRKLMGEHHPDKLVAKGLPPQMMEMAKQKAQEIQAAYDLVKREKGVK